MADAQGGGDGQALAMQTPTPPLAAPARRKRPVVPRMPRLREGTHRHLQGRPQAHLAVSGGSCTAADGHPEHGPGDALSVCRMVDPS
jgi:hypothetical protein